MSKEKIEKIIIGNTFFTFVTVIRRKLLRNIPKNNNYVQKDEKHLLSVIITLGRNFFGSDTYFMTELESITWD